MENQAQNSLWVKAFTPQGFQVGITIAIGSIADIVSASDLETALMQAGYLVAPEGIDPNAEIDTITHVACRMKQNSDGTTTPHIAFYHENVQLVYRFASAYLDAQDDRDLFERATGLKIANLPAVYGESHPKRGNGNNPNIVPLPKPIEIQTRRYEVEKDGETQKRVDFIGYVGVSKPDNASGGAPANNGAWSKNDQVDFYRYWNGVKKMEQQWILDALGVDALGAWNGTKQDAHNKLDAKYNAEKAG